MKSILLSFTLLLNIYFFGGNTAKKEILDNPNEFLYQELNSNIIDGCLVAEYGQYPLTAFTPLCLGVVEDVTPIGWAGEYSAVRVTNGTEYVFSSSVSTDYITIGNQGGTEVLASGAGTVTWTSDIDGYIRFYTHLDSSCTSSNTSSRRRSVLCGELLPPPINDECTNAIALSCGDSGTGQTFTANESGGRDSKDVFFTYTGNGVPENITMSLCGSSFNTYVHVYSDCTLTNVITYDDNYCGGAQTGDYSSQVSFTSDGVSTYVILVEGYSEEYFGDFVYELSCANVPPDPENCDDFEVLSNFGDEAYFGVTTGQRLAFDLPIGNEAFSAYGMTVNLITDMDISATSVNFRFFEDDAGVPGNQITTRIGSIIDSELVGYFFNAFIDNKYLVKFDAPVFFDANTRYWVEVETDALGWEYSTVYGSLGLADVQRSFTTGIWEPIENPQTNFVFELICNELDVSDINAVDFQYFPNPVKETLTLKSSKNIRTVTIYNSAGQIMSADNLSNSKDQINISSLAPGIYMFRVVLENDQIENFKIVK